VGNNGNYDIHVNGIAPFHIFRWSDIVTVLGADDPGDCGYGAFAAIAQAKPAIAACGHAVQIGDGGSDAEFDWGIGNVVDFWPGDAGYLLSTAL
jgi:hypothetical protein